MGQGTTYSDSVPEGPENNLPHALLQHPNDELGALHHSDDLTRAPSDRWCQDLLARRTASHWRANKARELREPNRLLADDRIRVSVWIRRTTALRRTKPRGLSPIANRPAPDQRSARKQTWSDREPDRMSP